MLYIVNIQYIKLFSTVCWKIIYMLLDKNRYDNCFTIKKAGGE